MFRFSHKVEGKEAREDFQRKLGEVLSNPQGKFIVLIVDVSKRDATVYINLDSPADCLWFTYLSLPVLMKATLQHIDELLKKIREEEVG